MADVPQQRRLSRTVTAIVDPHEAFVNDLNRGPICATYQRTQSSWRSCDAHGATTPLGLGRRRTDMSTWRSVASRRATHSPTHRHRATAAFVSTGVDGHPRATVASPPRPDKAAAAYSASCLRRLLPLARRSSPTAGRAAAARLPRPRRHLRRPGHPHGLRRHLVPLFRCRSAAEGRGFPSRAGF